MHLSLAALRRAAAAALVPTALLAQPPFPHGRARVSGTVVDSATGRAIVRARVCRELELGPPFGRGIRCASPDSLGRFTLDSLPEGRQVVTVTCTGRRVLDVRLLRADTLEIGPGEVARVDVRTGAAGCDMRPFVERRGEFAGRYTFGFEESRFTPCGDTLSAWVTFAPSANDTAIRWPAPNDKYYPSYFVRWVGTLRGPWHYGHLGVSPYEFVVERVLEVRRAGRRDGCRR
jgi:hypothetical protein